MMLFSMAISMVSSASMSLILYRVRYRARFLDVLHAILASSLLILWNFTCCFQKTLQTSYIVRSRIAGFTFFKALTRFLP